MSWWNQKPQSINQSYQSYLFHPISLFRSISSHCRLARDLSVRVRLIHFAVIHDCLAMCFARESSSWADRANTNDTVESWHLKCLESGRYRQSRLNQPNPKFAACAWFETHPENCCWLPAFSGQCLSAQGPGDLIWPCPNLYRGSQGLTCDNAPYRVEGVSKLENDVFQQGARKPLDFRTLKFEIHPLDPRMTAAMIGPAGKWGYGVDKSPFESDGHACLSTAGDQRCAPKKWRVLAVSRGSLRLDWIPPSTLKLEACLIMFECV